jgi:hypothetical protein
MANAHRSRGGKGFTPKDFMPEFDRPKPKQQTPEQLKAIFRLFTQAAGGTFTKAQA